MCVTGDPTSSNNGLSYFYSDHLGSNSALRRPNGTVETTRYLPFGGYRGTPPSQTITDRDFTGQKENMELGLLYYNARFYLPNTNRMVSPDTIVPDPTNPQSFNRYSYSYNNPVRYTDPSGHCIEAVSAAACWLLGTMVATTLGVQAIQHGNLSLWNPLNYPTITEINGQRVSAPTSSNVTSWLAEQMVNTANSQVVADMAGFWQGGNIDQMGVLAVWTAMVRTDGVWDFKPDILRAGVTFGEDLITLGSHDLNFQTVANIFFGFIGRQIGMSEGLLQFGAGSAQAEHGLGHWLGNITNYPGGWGDQEFDAWSIAFGFYLHDLYGNDLSQLTDEVFTQALDDYIADNPIPPGP